jgi:sugar porter (SP) family MFS transporter
MSTAVPAPPAESPEVKSLNRKVVGITVGAALGGFLFGFDSSVINGAVDSIQGLYGLSDAATGFTVASALLGCAVGAWFAGSVANHWGRIRVMVIAAALFFVSAIASGLAFNVWDLILWRVVGGLAVGAASVIAPAYIAEVAPAKARGRLGSLQQLAIVLGIFAALLTSQLFATTAGGASQDLWLGLEAWRWMFMAEVIPAVLYGVIALRLPESPRYLVGKNRDAEAEEILLKYSAEDDTAGKVAEIKASLGDEQQQSLADLKGHSFGLKPIVWTGIILAALQQLVGINVIFYYSTTLWQSVGFSESDAFLTSTITSVTNIVVTIVAILLVDRVGRRRLLLVGSVGMFLMLALMAVAFSHAKLDAEGNAVLSGHAANAALIGANGFVVFFGATWGPVVWVLLGEMFPNAIRAVALAVAAAVQWVANFAVTVTFPPLSSFSLSFAYGLYAFMALVSFFFVLRRIRETKGVELEEMTDTGAVQRVAS